MKFARLTRVSFTEILYLDASVWVNFDLVIGMSNANSSVGGGAYVKVLLVDTGPAPPLPTPQEGPLGEALAALPPGQPTMRLVTLQVTQTVEEILRLLA